MKNKPHGDLSCLCPACVTWIEAAIRETLQGHYGVAVSALTIQRIQDEAVECLLELQDLAMIKNIKVDLLR
jgi:hypothetical protein